MSKTPDKNKQPPGKKRSQKKRKSTTVDPDRANEAQKYDNPVPSRKFITTVLIEAGSPLDFAQLVERLGIAEGSDQEEGIRRRLGAMIRDGQIVRNRKGGHVPVDAADLVVGRIIAHPDGFGFLTPDAGDQDIYLNGKQMRQVLHGDRAVVNITGLDRRGRQEGRIVDVLERANSQLVGRYEEERGVYFVEPDNKRIHQPLLIPAPGRGNAQPGDMVIAEIVEQPTRRHPPVGRITEVLGQHLKPGMETDVAIASYDIPFHWPESVEAAVRDISPTVSEADTEGRRDIRQLPLVTIDGADARDFDDAVYAEPHADGWRLFVAIADVSHYVKPGTELDDEALKRGTSVYFPSRVVPMLPEVLSNGLCSLNPNVDRLCMLCEMTLTETGDIKRTRFYRAVMRSHARLTYAEVAAMVVDRDDTLRTKHATLVSHLDNLHQLYRLLQGVRQQRGAIEFDTVETRMLFDESQKIRDIVPVVRNDAHKMIEECMILANIAAARHLDKKKMPALYRVHGTPKADRVDDLRSFLALHHLSLSGGSTPTAHDYAVLSRAIAERPDANVIQTVMLRSMQQAVYQPVNDGHFGLALSHYAHFTSPIRRYPDLLVHRAIGHIIDKGKISDYRYSRDAMVELGEQCSMAERRADEATRDVVNWLKCEYMQDHVGEQFNGVVSTVTSFGLFVQLNDVFVEGLVHITSLDKDYYHFDQASFTLTGERAGERYQLGDALVVEVAAVNLEDRKIDFRLISRDPSAPSLKKGRVGQKKRAAKKAGANAGDKDTQSRKKQAQAGQGKKTQTHKTHSKKTEGQKTEEKKTQSKKTQAKKTQAKNTPGKKTRSKKTPDSKTSDVTSKAKSGHSATKKVAGKKKLSKKAAKKLAERKARQKADRKLKAKADSKRKRKKRV